MAEALIKRDLKNTQTIERAHTSAVTEGEVVDFSMESRELVVAHDTVAADKLGTYVRKGEISIDLDSGITVSQGDKIYWNDTTNKGTDVASGNKFLGTAAEAQATAAGYVKVLLNEQPSPEVASVTSGVTTGKFSIKSVALTAALLDTSANDLVAMAKGDIILGWDVNMGTAAGATCVLDIGSDAALDGTGADADAFGIDIDMNATGFTLHTASGKAGADLQGSPFTCVGAGNIEVTASTDQSATGAAGTINIYYIPAGV